MNQTGLDTNPRLSPTNTASAAIVEEQRRLYEGDFYRKNRWRWLFRDDCRYRWHRLRDILQQIGFPMHRRNVLEVGFGSADLLLRFPSSCRLMGLELSRAAVEAVQGDQRLAAYRDHWFETMADGPPPDTPVAGGHRDQLAHAGACPRRPAAVGAGLRAAATRGAAGPLRPAGDARFRF